MVQKYHTYSKTFFRSDYSTVLNSIKTSLSAEKVVGNSIDEKHKYSEKINSALIDEWCKLFSI